MTMSSSTPWLFFQGNGDDVKKAMALELARHLRRLRLHILINRRWRQLSPVHSGVSNTHEQPLSPKRQRIPLDDDGYEHDSMATMAASTKSSPWGCSCSCDFGRERKIFTILEEGNRSCQF